MAASGSGQQREGNAVPDDESGMQDEDKPEIDNEERAASLGVSTTNTRRRIAMKSEPRAVTTQKAVDGYREKAMRIESVEQIEHDSIMELSITGQVLSWARQSILSGGFSLRKADGWNMKNHSHLTVARHMREKIHLNVLVVTIVQCGAERVVKDCQRSDWTEMRSCHGAEQRVNNLDKSECENLAERDSRNTATSRK